MTSMQVPKINSQLNTTTNYYYNTGYTSGSHSPSLSMNSRYSPNLSMTSFNPNLMGQGFSTINNSGRHSPNASITSKTSSTSPITFFNQSMNSGMGPGPHYATTNNSLFGGGFMPCSPGGSSFKKYSIMGKGHHLRKIITCVVDRKFTKAKYTFNNFSEVMNVFEVLSKLHTILIPSSSSSSADEEDENLQVENRNNDSINEGIRPIITTITNTNTINEDIIEKQYN